MIARPAGVEGVTSRLRTERHAQRRRDSHISMGSIVALLCSLVGGNAFAQTAPSILKYRDTALSGNVTGEVAKSLAECHRICEERSGCKGFDHLAATNSCRLFSEISGGLEKRGAAAGTRIALPGYRAPDNFAPKPSVPSQSGWLHNGSTMILHNRPRNDGGSDVTIVYDVPKPDLIRAGIRQGAVLFEGRLVDGVLSGNARLTSSRCGAIKYDVEGRFLAGRAFRLAGPAPRRDNDCSIASWSTTSDNANLGFEPLN